MTEAVSPMVPNFQRRGLLCVVSGPSGSGKTTLCRTFSERESGATYAVSCTTRAPRTGEIDGKDYYFLSREEFESRAESGDFLEWAEVHGNLYGTLKSEVVSHIEAGIDVLMDIDVQGANSIRAINDPIIVDSLVDIFIMLDGEEAIIERLGQRGTESAEQLATRLETAREEMRHWQEYGWLIVSGTKEEDYERFRAILTGERCRTRRVLPLP